MGTHPIFESDFDCLTGCLEMKVLLVLLGLGAAQQGCIQNCTQTFADELNKCSEAENVFQKMKCILTAGYNWGTCCENCKPDPCNTKCLEAYEAAVTKCNNAGLDPKDELLCLSDAFDALGKCRHKCKN